MNEERYNDWINDLKWDSYLADPEDILNDPDRPWIWSLVSISRNIPFEFILEHQNDFPWESVGVTMNINVTFETVQANPDFPWDFAQLCMNQNIDWLVVSNNPDFPWSGYHLTCNPNFTRYHAKLRPDLDWDLVTIGTFGEPDEQFLPNRARYRTSLFKEELLAAVFHPDRVTPDWLESH